MTTNSEARKRMEERGDGVRPLDPHLAAWAKLMVDTPHAQVMLDQWQEERDDLLAAIVRLLGGVTKIAQASCNGGKTCACSRIAFQLLHPSSDAAS